MICPRCGTINDGIDQFCGNCGAVMASSRPDVNRTPVPPAAQYDASMDAPTMAQTFPLAQPTQYVSPPTQYVPPEYGPGGAWAAQQGGYPAPTQAGWADYPIAQPVPPSAYSSPTGKKRRRWPWYLLLFLVIFGVVLSTSWIFLLRPAVHQSVDGEIRAGLQQAIDQIPSVPVQIAPPGSMVPAKEADINAYLAQNVSALAPITDMHVSLQPGVMVVTFQAYGFGSTIHLGLAVQDGILVATNVDVSGLLWWVETNSDLTTRFDEALAQVPDKLGRKLTAVAIDTGVIVFTLA